MATSKKSGPPVPPRPLTGLKLNDIKNNDSSKNQIPLRTYQYSTIKQSPTTTTATGKSTAGRTVVYKSPSIDIKKKQSHYEQHHQNENNDRFLQKSSSILLKNNKNNDINRNYYESSASSTYKIAVNQNDNIKQQNTVFVNRPTPPIMRRNRTEISIRNDKNHNNNENIMKNNQNLNKYDKIFINNNNNKSPIPKPRTLLPVVNKQNSNNINIINNNIDNQRIIYRSHSTLCSVTSPTKLSTTAPIFIKNNQQINDNHNNIINIKNNDIENNLKNVAERLFTEIIINQTTDKPKIDDLIDNNHKNYFEKTEHCISVRSTPSPTSNITKLNDNSMKLNQNNNNTTCVNLLHRPEPEGECEITKPQETNKKPIKPISTILPISSVITNNGIIEKKVAFHQILIDELAAMREKSTFKKDFDPTITNIDHDLSDDQDDNNKNNIVNKLRKRYPSGCSTDSSPYGTQRSTISNGSRIRTSDWIEVGDNGKKVTLTSCNISLEDSGLEDEIERLEDYSSGVGDSWDSVMDNKKRMCIPGLPPLPKSLSGILDTTKENYTNSNLLETHQNENIISSEVNCQKTTDVKNVALNLSNEKSNLTSSKLDEQLAVLRKEMFGLRQLDLSLLSQLWALNESIQEFRTLLQENDTQSPPSPSPYPSDANSVSSDGEDDQVPSASIIKLNTKSQQQQQQQQQQQLNNNNNHLTVGHPQNQQRMRNAPPPPPPSRKAPQRPK